jgi:hypothetical protein
MPDGRLPRICTWGAAILEAIALKKRGFAARGKATPLTWECAIHLPFPRALAIGIDRSPIIAKRVKINRQDGKANRFILLASLFRNVQNKSFILTCPSIYLATLHFFSYLIFILIYCCSTIEEVSSSAPDN